MADDGSTFGPHSSQRPLIFVIFGRPGAGKSTVANAVLSRSKDGVVASRHSSAKESAAAPNLAAPLNLLGLDLDVCVPQWMRDNFAAGIYPTLAERETFADSACDYVEAQIAAKLQDAPGLPSSQPQESPASKEDLPVVCHQPGSQLAGNKPDGESEPNSPFAVLVSFSFVNEDLRASFRRRFPTSVWCLMDTSSEEASERIAKREGHFYKGSTKASPPSSQSGQGSKSDNDDWSFAPVDFPHIVLDGRDTIENNAASALAHLHQSVCANTRH
jgi:hypothetical protein